MAEVGRPVQKKTVQVNKSPFVSGDCSQNLSFAPLVTKEEESTMWTQGRFGSKFTDNTHGRLV